MINVKKYWLALTVLTLFSNIVLAADEDQYISVRKTLQTCFTCHGDKGAATIGTFPILAGQEFYYLYVQLKDMKKGLRASAVMSPIVANIKKED